MNIAEILKKCPKGTKLYSSTWANVELLEVTREKYIIIKLCNDKRIKLFSNGAYSVEGDCILFPSRKQRDWSKFDVYQFKPFDRVLVRDSNSERWRCDFFEQQEEKEGFNVRCFRGVWCQCIPYNGNEHLLGTTNKPKQ